MLGTGGKSGYAVAFVEGNELDTHFSLYVVVIVIVVGCFGRTLNGVGFGRLKCGQ